MKVEYLTIEVMTVTRGGYDRKLIAEAEKLVTDNGFRLVGTIPGATHSETIGHRVTKGGRK